MIQELNKDHHIISDLIFTEFENIQQCLLDTFYIYIELFVKTNCTKLLEVIYLKDIIKPINFSKLYYQISINNDLDINQLQTTIKPIFEKSSIVLESIANNPKTLAYHTSFHNYSMILNLHQEYNEIFTTFNSILSRFQKYFMDYNTPQISIKLTHAQDESFNQLINDLYHLDELLKDLKEDIIKNSPCFKDFTQQKIKSDQQFDEYKYHLFKNKRIERLGIDRRTIFGVV